ncbi:MAG: Glu/Leu/Phe/Val dehydrogenase dimerization domain-containing protein [Henriciella sp.]|nr:Glu/Leu/Phe/Val dehydrogenase dimerization domain-containing protein [Henriciella sp.]
MFDLPDFDAHEGVHAFHDQDSGLRCIIAIHSTALGPSAGGTRMWNYSSGAEMVTDALRLSQGMSYKNAMAGIPHGGGKAVIWGNSKTDKSEAMFLALGRAVESLQGRYYTAEDVGIDTADIEIAARETKYAAGLTFGAAASGDPSPVTGKGVFLGIKQASLRAFGTDDLSGRTVAVQGVGSVGGYACQHLADAGAKLVICDMDQEALTRVAARCDAKIVGIDEIYDVEADVFSPNALGAVINPDTLKRLKVKVIAGGANNQLATPEMGELVRQSGIIYAPDYVINGGGIINVASEISGAYSKTWVYDKLATLMDTLGEVLDVSLSQGKPTNVVADEIAMARIAAGPQEAH